MKTIDRYMLRQFVQTFLICYVSLTGLYIVFDAFANLDEFLRCAPEAGGLYKLLSSHYSYQTLKFFDLSAGLLTLIAAMFTVTWIQRHNEMTALMSAGISRLRVVAPVIAAAVGIAILAAASRELVIPRFRQQLARRPQDLIGDKPQTMGDRYDYKTDILLRGKSTFGDRSRIHKPRFLLPPALDQYGSQLVAEDAFYQPPQADRPGGYLLDKVEKPEDLDSRPSLTLDNDPVIITPLDAPEWLDANQCFVVSNVTFEQLTGGRAFRDFSSTRQLVAGLANDSLDFGPEIRVAVHSRILQPFFDVTLLFLGLPLVVGRGTRNVFIAIGLCGAVVSLFSLVVLAFQHLGSILVVSPAFGAWAPLMIFVPVAVGMAHAMSK
jgi:lipopolysaccharide export system permease protein